MTTTPAGDPVRRALHLALLLLLLVAGASGCGQGGGVGEVTGTIRLKDQLVLAGDVLFVTQNGEEKWGAIGPQGVYRVKDVPVGPVKVAILPRSPVPSGLITKPGQAPGGEGRTRHPRRPGPQEVHHARAVRPDLYRGTGQADLRHQVGPVATWAGPPSGPAPTWATGPFPRPPRAPGGPIAPHHTSARHPRINQLNGLHRWIFSCWARVRCPPRSSAQTWAANDCGPAG